MLSTTDRIPSRTSALPQPGQTEPDQKAGTDLTGTDQPLSQGLANRDAAALSENHQLECHGRFPVGMEGLFWCNTHISCAVLQCRTHLNLPREE